MWAHIDLRVPRCWKFLSPVSGVSEAGAWPLFSIVAFSVEWTELFFVGYAECWSNCDDWFCVLVFDASAAELDVCVCRTTHSLRSTHVFFSCTTHQSSFQNLFLRCHLSFVVKTLFRTLKRCRRALGVQRSTSLSCHKCSSSSPISQILTAKVHSQHLPLHVHCYHALDWFSIFSTKPE